MYVDDGINILKAIPKGIRYDKEQDLMTISTEQAIEDEYVEEDEHTMKVITEIANSIDVDMQFTYDVPSKYPNKKVPIMDMQI